jgi:hypothetical protein
MEKKDGSKTTRMFIRPALKVRPGPRLQFVIEQRPSGAQEAKWIPVYDRAPIIPNGAPGRVGEIVDAMRRGEAYITRPTPKPWTPPNDYEFIAKYMDKTERNAYIAKCKAWFDANPLPVHQTRAPPPAIDQELIHALFAKYPGAVPPFEDRIKVYRAAGHSEEYIAKVIARHEKLEETADERQKIIDRIFPNVPKKTAKPPTKVIKAVKKKMAHS